MRLTWAGWSEVFPAFIIIVTYIRIKWNNIVGLNMLSLTWRERERERERCLPKPDAGHAELLTTASNKAKILFTSDSHVISRQGTFRKTANPSFCYTCFISIIWSGEGDGLGKIERVGVLVDRSTQRVFSFSICCY
jgi:hypothetical protein